MFKPLKTLALVWWRVISQYALLFNLRKAMSIFLDTWLTIHRPELCRNQENFNHDRRIKLWTVRLTELLFVIRAAQLVFLAVFSTSLSGHTKTMLWDHMYFHGADSLYNITHAAYSSCLVVFNRMYFYGNKLDPSRETIWLVMQALSEGDNRKVYRKMGLAVPPTIPRRILTVTLNAMKYYNLYFGNYFGFNLNFKIIFYQHVAIGRFIR